jgi:hypothetical protein
MQKQNNKNKLFTLGFLTAVVASMAFMAVKIALGQGTNQTSMSGTNLTGTEGTY